MRLPGWIDGELVVEAFDRIAQTPGSMGGRAGIRVTVNMILGHIAAGYAAWRAEERDIDLALKPHTGPAWGQPMPWT